jgi:large subunit ribosomal protein L30
MVNKRKIIKIKQIRSRIGRPEKQRLILQGLGLKKLNQVVTKPDTPEIRGMVAKIPHLVTIIDEGSA